MCVEECYTSATPLEDRQKFCDNYRGISLLNVPGNLTLLEWLQTIMEPQLMVTQCGFRMGCSTIDQIWVTHQIVEKAAE